ncbi:hypothetical protein HPB50_020184 [Hyalomma asiaticum]|uniref:Uncharacterized protein n=1 Tax=Hyalomma asiaticum TaxID=266040 RepID=A0ACB7TMQ1_HYAAI|nr:hypothetical protein HPB50_020184 [Hyalomma asiaticum]
MTLRLGQNAIVCGDFSAHHADWGSRTTPRRGRELADVVTRAELHVLNTEGPTFVRVYFWNTAPDTRGSNHYPIVMSPTSGRQPRRRTYTVTDWVKFTRHCGEVPDSADFLDAIADCARAATVQCSALPNTAAPDLCQLNLWAARHQAKRRATPTPVLEYWTTWSTGWTPAAEDVHGAGVIKQAGTASAQASRSSPEDP